MGDYPETQPFGMAVDEDDGFGTQPLGTDGTLPSGPEMDVDFGGQEPQWAQPVGTTPYLDSGTPRRTTTCDTGKRGCNTGKRACNTGARDPRACNTGARDPRALDTGARDPSS